MYLCLSLVFFFSYSFIVYGLHQKRRGQTNPKSNSEKFMPEEDGGSGFPIEPSKGTTRNGFSHSGKSIRPMGFGSSQNMDENENEDDARMGTGQGSSSSRNGAESRIHKSYSHRGASQLSMFSGSVAVRGSLRFDNDRENNGMNRHWPEERGNAGCNELGGGAESSEKHQWSHHLLERPKSSHKKDEQPSEKESSMVNILSETELFRFLSPNRDRVFGILSLDIAFFKIFYQISLKNKPMSKLIRLDHVDDISVKS